MTHTIFTISLLLMFVSVPAVFAKPKEVVPATSIATSGPSDSTLGKSVDKVKSEVIEAVTDQLVGKDKKTVTTTTTTIQGGSAGSGSGLPPGLAKKGKVPPGLAKKGVTAEGWKNEKTETVVTTQPGESLIQKWIKDWFKKKEPAQS